MVWIVLGDDLATQSNDIPIWDPKSLGYRQISAIVDEPHYPGIPGKGRNFTFELLTIERKTVDINVGFESDRKSSLNLRTSILKNREIEIVAPGLTHFIDECDLVLPNSLQVINGSLIGVHPPLPFRGQVGRQPGITPGHIQKTFELVLVVGG